MQQRREAADEQRGADEQHARHRELSRHDEAAGARRPQPQTVTHRRAAVFRQRFDQVDATCVPCGSQSTDDTGGDRDAGREQDDAPVDGDGIDAREVGGQQRRKRALERHRERDARGAAAKSEDRVFDDELTRETREAGANRRADRHLAPSRFGARELEAGDVGRRRHEQQHHGRQQHEQRRAHVGRHLIDGGDRTDLGGPVAAEQRDGGHAGIRRAERARRPFRGRLFGRDAGTQARER